VDFKKGQPLKNFIHFGGHGVLSSVEVKLIRGEFCDGGFDAVHSGRGRSEDSH